MKIDRTFISHLDRNEDYSETDDQRRILTQLGSDSLQGYLFSKPLAAPELEQFMIGRPIVQRTADEGSGMIEELSRG